MYYLITKQTELSLSGLVYKPATIEDCINYLTFIQEISLDTETTGLDAHINRMFMLQVGDENNQYIIDCSTTDITVLKSILENKLIIGQNLKFDIKFLFKYGIYLKHIWDTYVVEKVLNCGLPNTLAALDILCERYLNQKLNKDERKTITRGSIDAKTIVYGAEDIKCLPGIKKGQIDQIKNKDLMGAVNLENRFTPCLAYIEYCGFKLDSDKWKSKMEDDNLLLQKTENVLNNWIMKKGLVKYIETQLDMFASVNCKINWASSKQVIQLFEDLGINCTIFDKGIKKKSVESKIIEKQSVNFDIIPLYLAYKKADKVVSTYGDSFLNQIHPVTGRIHTSFKQVLDTGRISSGGKDKATGENYINFQNIPSDPNTRSCFVAEPGNTLIISDYSGQEQIVLANKALDKNILKFYDDGLGDMHAFVASKMYPELANLTLNKIKTHHKDKRQRAKIAGFAINYGGVGQTIADQLNMTKEEGDAVYDAYFTAFPQLKEYFNQEKKKSLTSGYILISTVTKRKSYIFGFSKYTELSVQINKDFWDEYRQEKLVKTERYNEMKKIVSDYFYYKGEIERKSLNFPIQGSSAEITKLSCIYIWDYIIQNNFFDIIKFVNTVHDENVLECPLNIAEEVAIKVREFMCKAGDLFCKRVPLTADPELSIYWKK